MKHSFWLDSLFSRSALFLRNCRRSRRGLRRHRHRHLNRSLDARLEILETRVMLASDFGDAPIPYPTTLLAEGGAEHVFIVGDPRLGATVDSEPDGTHSAAADADGADEDGVTFGTMMVGALEATVTVNVQGSAGKLDAWIDFNGDGSWGGPGEQIFASRDVVLDDNDLTFDVPSFAIAGTTYARFRVSTAGGLGVGGAAADGEVEDYQVTIANPASSNGLFGGQNTITTAAVRVRSVFAADVDSDGDMDVLSASRIDDLIAWYENDGSQNFTLHTVSTAADSARSVFAADVDGDGDIDVLSASSLDDKIAWYENDGNQSFTPHTISTAADGATSVFAADVDGDGDIDVLSASRLDDKIAWYENDGSQSFTPHTISTAADNVRSVFAADVDGDGDLDVLSASALDDKIAWYKNDGSQSFTPHTISTAADFAYSVFAADVDGDGDLDVLSASAYDDKIAWYKNDGSENFTPHTISTTAVSARSVFAADVDGDGDLDVLSASANDNTIAWYQNDGSENFTPHTISTSADAPSGIFAADMDGDGDLDVLSASFDDDRVAWYENDGASADFDIDNDIDGFDFLAWQLGLGTLAPSATKGDGDADDDQDVDEDDLTLWENQYGTILAPLVAGPSSALLTSEPAATEAVRSEPLATTVSATALSANTWLAIPGVDSDTRPQAVVDGNRSPDQLSAEQFDSAFDRLPSTTSLAVASLESLLAERADELDDDWQSLDDVFREWDRLALAPE